MLFLSCETCQTKSHGIFVLGIIIFIRIRSQNFELIFLIMLAILQLTNKRKKERILIEHENIKRKIRFSRIQDKKR